MKLWKRVLILLLMFTMLISASSEALAAGGSENIVVREQTEETTVLFEETFENGVDQDMWNVGHGTPSTGEAPEGDHGQSYSVNEDADTISHTFTEELSAIATIWLYDSGEDGKFRGMISVDDGKDKFIRSAGIQTDKSKDYYAYRVNSNWTVTEVPRTKGWHKFAFDYSGLNTVTISIDDVVVASQIESPDGFQRIQIGDPGTKQGYVSHTFFDDVTVIEGKQETENVISGTVLITGTAKVGETLTADVSGITPETARENLTYQWYRGEETIAGAIAATYEVTETDLDQTVCVKVTATGEYTGTLTSTPVTVIGDSIKISGTVGIPMWAIIGETITAYTAEIQPKEAIDGLIYQWYCDDEPIVGANSVSYMVDEEILGKKISVVVTVSGEYKGTLTSNTADVITIPVDEQVAPVDWGKFTNGIPTDDNSKLVGNILNTALRYELNTWWWKKFGIQTGEYLDFGGNGEGHIRPSASVAFGLATAIQTGLYDEDVIGYSVEEAKEVAIRLISSLSYRHKANGGEWGDAWQSCLWAYFTGYAGWLLWDDLDAASQQYVRNMVVHEANRTNLMEGYFRDKEGNLTNRARGTAAEESGWNAALVNLAVCMMPNHPNQAIWQNRALELMITAMSRPSDLENMDILHGKPVKEWIEGSNINEDGTAVNHGRIHPDYMNLINPPSIVAEYALIGKGAPKACVFNQDIIYRTFSDLEFTEGDYIVGGVPFEKPVLAPGGTIYIDASGDIYYPHGNDWGFSRIENFVGLDSAAVALGFDELASQKAEYWLNLHGGKLAGMQARHEDGHTFEKGELNYGGAEEGVVQFVSRGYMLLWLKHQDAISFQNDAPLPLTDESLDEEFIEDFENGTDRWEIFNGSKDLFESAEETKHSYVLDEDRDAIVHNFKESHQGRVNVWIYDSMADGEYRPMILVDDTKNARGVGIRTDLSRTNYVTRIGDTWTATKVPRSKGWHEVLFEYSEEGLEIFIDNHSVSKETGISKYNRIQLGDVRKEGFVSNVMFDNIGVTFASDKNELSGEVTVSGAPEVGEKLTADVSKVLPTASRESLTYQWYRGDKAIHGATDAAYQVTEEDLNQSVRVYVAGDGETYTGFLFSESVTIKNHTHTWKSPVWTWDGYKASVKFVCEKNENHVEEPEVTVTNKVTKEATCTEKGEKTYTATVTFEGKDYTDTVVEVLPMEPHHLEDGICVNCGKNFNDDSNKHKHIGDGAWVSDMKEHWHVCECGEIIGKEIHTVGKDGVCTGCGKVLFTPNDGIDNNNDNSTQSPNTGDTMNALPLVVLLGVALIAAAEVLKRRKAVK